MALRNLANYIDAVGYRMGQENLEMMQEDLELSQSMSDEMLSFLEDWVDNFNNSRRDNSVSFRWNNATSSGRSYYSRYRHWFMFTCR